MTHQCPNVFPGFECVDPDCAYCKIARAEEPTKTKPDEPVKTEETIP